MQKPAAIDNDFLNHLVQTRGGQEELCDIIIRFFQSLDLSPQLHELIWKHETQQGNPVIQQLLNNEIVRICSMDQMLMCDAGKKRYYKTLVEEIYHKLNGENYPCDVFEGWRAQKSLGEIHCIVMCMFMNYECLLSDDKEAKKLRRVMHLMAACDIPIWSRSDCRSYLQKNPDRCFLHSRDLHRLCHVRD